MPSPTIQALPQPGELPHFDPSIHRLTKWEGFESVVVHRSQVNEAPYNPRIIRDKARGRLKAGIEEVGVVVPLVWNRRTGTLVGGHQRLKIIDGLEHTRDYWITVAQIDVDLDREQAINLLLNNAETEGEWDIPKLHDLLVNRETPLKLEATGFGADDLYSMFGHQAFHGEEGASQIDKLADQLREKREAYERVVNTAKNSQEAENRRSEGEAYYAVVVFQNGKDRDSFLREIYGYGEAGPNDPLVVLDHNHWYLDGRDLRRIFRARVGEKASE